MPMSTDEKRRELIKLLSANLTPHRIATMLIERLPAGTIEASYVEWRGMAETAPRTRRTTRQSPSA